MRIRSTKPEFWRSKRIASVSWEHRLLLKGLESYVDDNGVGQDDIALIVGDLFQRDLVLDASGTLRKVQEGLFHLNQAGLLWRYDHEGTPLLYIAFWEKAQYVQKALAGRNPRPDGTFNYKDSLIGASPPETSGAFRNLPALNREQGNRGTGEQGKKLSNDLKETYDCNVREFSSDEIEEVAKILGAHSGDFLDELETATALEFILEAASVPVQDVAAYVRACVESTPERISKLCGEARRQVALTRA